MQVLQRAFWPPFAGESSDTAVQQTTALQDVHVPPAMQDLVQAFTAFYQSQFSSRKVCYAAVIPSFCM